MTKHGNATNACKASNFHTSQVKHLGVISSYPALALSIGFFAVTVFVLFKDVADGAQITTDHVMSFAVLVGTFASGHLLSEQLRQWRLLPALGLLVLFVAGTFYCVTASGGRNATVQSSKADDAHKSNDDRARTEADLKIAKDRLLEAQDKEADECASGKKLRCEGRQATRQERQAYVDILEARLRLMDGPKVEYPELRHAAKVFASIVSVGEQAIFDKLVLWFPFVKALFCEIATLVFGSIALRHATFPISLPTDESNKASHPKPVTFASRVKVSPNVLPFQRKQVKPLQREMALSDLLSLGSIPSQETLADRWHRSEATVSRWIERWEQEGKVKRSQDGRCKGVSAV